MIFCPPIRPCQRDNVAAELLADMLLLSSSLEDLSSFARNIQPGSRGESFQRLVRLDNILDARLGVLEVFDVPGKHGKSFVRHGGGRWNFRKPAPGDRLGGRPVIRGPGVWTGHAFQSLVGHPGSLRSCLASIMPAGASRNIEMPRASNSDLSLGLPEFPESQARDRFYQPTKRAISGSANPRLPITASPARIAENIGWRYQGAKAPSPNFMTVSRSAWRCLRRSSL